MDYGDDASVVTRSIGLEATFIGVPGQPNAQFPKMARRVHEWESHSPLGLSAHIDDHFEALLHLLAPHAEAIKAASKIWDGGINVAIYY